MSKLTAVAVVCHDCRQAQPRAACEVTQVDGGPARFFCPDCVAHVVYVVVQEGCGDLNHEHGINESVLTVLDTCATKAAASEAMLACKVRHVNEEWGPDNDLFVHFDEDNDGIITSVALETETLDWGDSSPIGPRAVQFGVERIVVRGRRADRASTLVAKALGNIAELGQLVVDYVGEFAFGLVRRECNFLYGVIPLIRESMHPEAFLSPGRALEEAKAVVKSRLAAVHLMKPVINEVEVARALPDPMFKQFPQYAAHDYRDDFMQLEDVDGGVEMRTVACLIRKKVGPIVIDDVAGDDDEDDVAADDDGDDAMVTAPDAPVSGSGLDDDDDNNVVGNAIVRRSDRKRRAPDRFRLGQAS